MDLKKKVEVEREGEGISGGRNNSMDDDMGKINISFNFSSKN